MDEENFIEDKIGRTVEFTNNTVNPSRVRGILKDHDEDRFTLELLIPIRDYNGILHRPGELKSFPNSAFPRLKFIE